MNLYFSDQSKKFDLLLNELIKRPVMEYDKKDLIEKRSEIKLNIKNFETLDFEFFWHYEIFPSALLTYWSEWQREGRQMKIGDSILQQTFIPPSKTFSQKIVFGVRINNIINERNRKSFSYQTLEGHVEKGESTFTLEDNGNETIFSIHTYSKPGNFLTKLAGPFFTLPYQAYCTRRALENVRCQIEQ